MIGQGPFDLKWGGVALPWSSWSPFRRLAFLSPLLCFPLRSCWFPAILQVVKDVFLFPLALESIVKKYLVNELADRFIGAAVCAVAGILFLCLLVALDTAFRFWF